jgi:hypothetical protein
MHTYNFATFQKQTLYHVKFQNQTYNMFSFEEFEVTKGWLESVNRRMTDNTMTKRKRTNGQTTNNKIYTYRPYIMLNFKIRPIICLAFKRIPSVWSTFKIDL